MADPSEVAFAPDFTVAQLSIEDDDSAIHLYVADEHGKYTITVPIGHGPEGLIASQPKVVKGWDS